MHHRCVRIMVSPADIQQQADHSRNIALRSVTTAISYVTDGYPYAAGLRMIVPAALSVPIRSPLQKDL